MGARDRRGPGPVCHAGVVPDFRAFRGERYAPDVPLDLVVAPPYDVIDAEERVELAARHPANAVAVEVPLPPPDDPDGDRYAHAAAVLRDWRAGSVLRADPRDAVYPYRMTAPDGRSTTGVLGLLPCGPAAEGVLPHEETTPKDMHDRLSLLRACRANLSPVWGLSLATGLGALLDPDRPPDATATAEGVRHELWVGDEPRLRAAVAEAVRSADVVLADGHHRYQTAATYAAERAAAGLDDPGAAWILALVVELSPEALAVGPIHRAVRCPGGAAAVLDAAGRAFELRPVPDGTASTAVAPAAPAEPGGGPVLVVASGCWELRPRPATVAAAVAASPTGTAPDQVVDSLLAGMLLAEVPGATAVFDHDADRVRTAVAGGTADAALLLRPVPVAAIGTWAAAGRRMPPKSTYFWPKPRTGMVFRSLDG